MLYKECGKTEYDTAHLKTHQDAYRSMLCLRTHQKLWYLRVFSVRVGWWIAIESPNIPKLSRDETNAH